MSRFSYDNIYKDEVELEANKIRWEGLWEEPGLMKVLVLCATARTLQEDSMFITKLFVSNFPSPVLPFPLSWHKGQSVHRASSAFMCWVATLFFPNKYFLVTKHLVHTIFQLTFLRLNQGSREQPW